MQQTAIVALVIFIAGLVYHAGRMSVRVERLEADAIQTRTEFTRAVENLERMLRAAISERRNWRGDHR